MSTPPHCSFSSTIVRGGLNSRFPTEIKNAPKRAHHVGPMLIPVFITEMVILHECFYYYYYKLTSKIEKTILFFKTFLIQLDNTLKLPSTICDWYYNQNVFILTTFRNCLRLHFTRLKLNKWISSLIMSLLFYTSKIWSGQAVHIRAIT